MERVTIEFTRDEALLIRDMFKRAGAAKAGELRLTGDVEGALPALEAAASIVQKTRDALLPRGTERKGHIPSEGA